MLARDHRRLSRTLRTVAVAGALLTAALIPSQAAETVTVGGQAFTNKGLVGVGRLPADLRDKFGETVGSGSGFAANLKTWARNGDRYQGTFFLLPDRGYNVDNTTDFRARFYTLSITLKPSDDPTKLPADERQRTVAATLTDTTLLTDAAGRPMTGLDPVENGVRAAADGFPDMPQAATGALSLDSESFALMPDGTFFIGDEYGPYVYRFSPEGKLLSAIRPPDAFIPIRNDKAHFSSNNPGAGVEAPKPPNPVTGRQNNQGFEGMSVTPDGKFMAMILQSATRQDGGDSAETRQHTRILYYDIADPAQPKLVREHVVPLPMFKSADGKTLVAAQSELLALDETHFLLLCRDSNNGYGMKGSTSLYRKIELLDTSGATNIVGGKYDGTVPLAPKGKLEDGIVPATLTSFIDINDNSQLNRFGLHNGEPVDRNLLSEKWEGMTLVPALDPANPRDFFLFVSNDNDFITKNGFQVGQKYEGAADVDTMILVYRLTLPALSKEANVTPPATSK
jgi:hypothetical protein